eukprot:g934.t1
MAEDTIDETGNAKKLTDYKAKKDEAEISKTLPYGRWEGRVLVPGGGENNTHSLRNPHYLDEDGHGIPHEFIKQMMTFEMDESEIDTSNLIVGFCAALAHDMLYLLEESCKYESPQNSKKEAYKPKKQVLNELPLSLAFSIRPSRLKLGATISGTLSAGTSMQLVPQYTRNVRYLMFLRGIFKFVKQEAGKDGYVFRVIRDADRLLRRLGVTRVMSNAGMDSYCKEIDKDRDRTLLLPHRKKLKNWCKAKRDHRLQVEAYCNVLQNKNGEEIEIRHAGLIYGFWKKKPKDIEKNSKSRNGKGNCYHIPLYGALEDINKDVDDQLKELVEDFKKTK